MKLLIITLLSALFVAVFGVCVELVLRNTGIEPVQHLLSADLATYEKVPGIWAPGQDITWKHVPSLPHRIRINSAGYRGAEFDIQKGSDEFRVLMVGDSYTFGNNVGEAETMPYQLEQELYEVCENKSFTVINAGISGSTIRGQTEMVKRGMSLNPDLVVLVFTETDIPELPDPLWDRMYNNRMAKSKFPVSVFWPLVRDTATWAFIAKGRETISMRTRRQYEVIEGSEDKLVHDELKLTYIKELNKLAAQIEEQESGFVVVNFPGNHAARGEPYIDTLFWAMEEFPKNGITTINLIEPLRRALGDNIDSAYLLPEDGHPSKLGYKIAATTMARSLMTQAALQNRCRDSHTSSGGVGSTG